MIDLHIHLARLPYKEQLTQLLLDRHYDFIAIACEPWEWKEVSFLKKRFSTGVRPFKVAYGIHPMIATQADEGMFADLRGFLQQDGNAMVGEAGIDKRYPGYDDGTQDQVFLKQAELALELKRDLQIHCVGDYMRVLRLLTKAGFPQDEPWLSKAPRPIFHRFGGDVSFLKRALPYGALFSLHADSFRKKSTAATIPLIPHERVYFETDADETFMRGNSAAANANNVILTLAEGKDPATSTAIVDPGTGSGVTDKSVAGVTSESAESDDNVFLSNAKEPVTFSPEEIFAELESRLESVRAAYAKCSE